jgi:hypothetical protein
MIKFRPHAPAFVDVNKSFLKTKKFISRESFMDLFKNVKDIPLFYKIVLGDYCKYNRGYYVMALLDNGNKWYVLGWLSRKTIVHLPRWHIPI